MGELLALKRTGIDFEVGNLTVNRTIQKVTQILKDGAQVFKLIEQDTKTKDSNITVPISKDILSKLKLHKKEQSKYKLYVGEIYNNKNYVLVDELGNLIDDKRPGRNLKTILKSIHIEAIKFRVLRHTYATRLFEAKVPPKTVQVLMDHYDISITMDIYTYVMEDVKIEAVYKLNDIFKYSI